MLAETAPGSMLFGPEFIEGCGPYYDSKEVDAEIERLEAEIERLYGLLYTVAENGWTHEVLEAMEAREAATEKKL
jgi:hypothetical protein